MIVISYKLYEYGMIWFDLIRIPYMIWWIWYRTSNSAVFVCFCQWLWYFSICNIVAHGKCSCKCKWLYRTDRHAKCYRQVYSDYLVYTVTSSCYFVTSLSSLSLSVTGSFWLMYDIQDVNSRGGQFPDVQLLKMTPWTSYGLRTRKRTQPLHDADSDD